MPGFALAHQDKAQLLGTGAAPVTVARDTLRGALRLSGCTVAGVVLVLLLIALLTVVYRQQFHAAEAELTQVHLHSLMQLWLGGLSLEATLMADALKRRGMGASFQRQEEIENEMHENIARRLRALGSTVLPNELVVNGTALLRKHGGGAAVTGMGPSAEAAALLKKAEGSWAELTIPEKTARELKRPLSRLPFSTCSSISSWRAACSSRIAST